MMENLMSLYTGKSGAFQELSNLRNPLTNILLSVESLQQDKLEETEKKYLLNIILNNGQKMERMIMEICNTLKDDHTYSRKIIKLNIQQ